MTIAPPPPAPPLPGQPDLPPQPTRAVGLAVASLVLGICGVIPCLGVLLALVGITLGIVALAKKTTASGMAIGGIASGAVMILIIQGLLFAIMIPSLSQARVMAKRAVCAANLNALDKAMDLYELDTGYRYPQDMQILLREGYVADATVFRCPMTDGSREVDYFYFAPIVSRLSRDVIIACDLLDNHAGKGRNVLLASGSIEWMVEEGFQEELEKPINAAFAAALRDAEGP